MLLSSIRHSWTHVEGNKWRTPYHIAKNGYRIGYTMYALPCKKCKKLCMAQSGKKTVFCSRKCWGVFRDWSYTKNPAWKGGRPFQRERRLIYAPGHKNANQGNGNYVPEHRYVMAKHLGRPLKSTEIVHHVNHDKRDNRLSNLVILSRTGHATHHANHYWKTHKLIVVPK